MSSTKPQSRSSLLSWFIVLGGLIIIAAVIIPVIGKTSKCGPRTASASDLRQLGQASIIYASEHDDHFPSATDIWDYARQIAESVDLDYAQMWQARSDPAADTSPVPTRNVLDPEPIKPRRLNPTFRQIKPSISVALGKLDMTMPATTPILWTRGLQLDGTWAMHSPFGASGGYIMFMGGNTASFTDIKASDRQLTRFDGKGTTSNILEALPPGTRIGEYEPTPQEKTEWARINRERAAAEKRSLYAPLIFIALIWLPFIALSIYRGIKKRPGALTVLLWPVLIFILASLLIPGLWHIGPLH